MKRKKLTKKKIIALLLTAVLTTGGAAPASGAASSVGQRAVKTPSGSEEEVQNESIDNDADEAETVGTDEEFVSGEETTAEANTGADEDEDASQIMDDEEGSECTDAETDSSEQTESKELPVLNAEEPDGDYEEGVLLITYEDQLPDLDSVSQAVDEIDQIRQGAEEAGIPAENVLADAVQEESGDSSAELAISASAEEQDTDGTADTSESQNDAGSEEITLAETDDSSGTADASSGRKDAEQNTAEDDLASAAGEALEPLNETEQTLALLGISDQEVISDQELGTENYSLTAAELPEEVSMGEAIAVLEETPGVLCAEPNYQITLAETETASVNDPYAINGAAGKESQYYLYQSNFPEAWKLLEQAYGSMDVLEHSVTVAVLDSGCRYTHQDLEANLDLDRAYDAADQCLLTDFSSAKAEATNQGGHGTHVCGLLSAVTDNGVGIAGAACNTVKILPVRIFDTDGSCTSKDAILALQYLMNVDDLRAINMSFVMSGDSTSLHLAVQKISAEKDLLCICAGGNGDEISTPHTEAIYPSDWEECMSVTSLTLDKEGNATDTAYSDYNADKDISAFGTSDYSTTWSSDRSYGIKSGTSMATPLVTAAAALLWSYDASLTSAEVRDLLTSTASPVVHDAAREGNTGSAGALDIGAAMQKLILQKQESTADDSGSVSLEQAEITLISDDGASDQHPELTYTGQALTPEACVRYDGQVLIQGTDYILSYKDNTDVGTALVYIQGIGAYSGTVQKTFTITPKEISASDVALSAEKFVYNAAVQKPSVTVTTSLNGAKATIADSITADNENVTLSYVSGCKKVGTYSVTVSGQGNFSGSVTKYFRIISVLPVMNQKLFGRISGSTLRLVWGKVSTADGYDIYASQSGQKIVLAKTVQGADVTTAQIGGMNIARAYMAKVKAWRMINGQKVYLGTSLPIHVAAKNCKKTNPLEVSVKTSALSLKTGETGKISASVTRADSTKKLLGHTATFRYWSMDDSIASVSSSGVITAEGSGTAVIYVMGENGRKARVTVTVP